MMKPDRRFSPPAVGGSSLLAMFAVLTISIFALLSISTVQGARRLSDSATQAVTDWYTADCEAEAIFARLRSGELPPQVQQNGDIYRYTCLISDHQSLFIELRHTNHRWEILRWQALPSQQTPEDLSLPVWTSQ